MPGSQSERIGQRPLLASAVCHPQTAFFLSAAQPSSPGWNRYACSVFEDLSDVAAASREGYAGGDELLARLRIVPENSLILARYAHFAQFAFGD